MLLVLSANVTNWSFSPFHALIVPTSYLRKPVRQQPSPRPSSSREVGVTPDHSQPFPLVPDVVALLSPHIRDCWPSHPSSHQLKQNSAVRSWHRAHCAVLRWQSAASGWVRASPLTQVPGHPALGPIIPSARKRGSACPLALANVERQPMKWSSQKPAIQLCTIPVENRLPFAYSNPYLWRKVKSNPKEPSLTEHYSHEHHAPPLYHHHRRDCASSTNVRFPKHRSCVCR